MKGEEENEEEKEKKDMKELEEEEEEVDSMEEKERRRWKRRSWGIRTKGGYFNALILSHVLSGPGDPSRTRRYMRIIIVLGAIITVVKA